MMRPDYEAADALTALGAEVVTDGWRSWPFRWPQRLRFKITDLNLRDLAIPDLLLRRYIPRLDALDVLNLNYTGSTDALVDLIPMQISSLALRGTRISDKALARLANLRLQFLDLGDTQITDRGLNLINVQDMEFLFLDSTRITSTSIKSFRSLPALTHLALSDIVIDESSVSVLVNAPRLEWLGLQRCVLDDAGLHQLCESSSLRLILATSVGWSDQAVHLFELSKHGRRIIR